MSSYIAYPFIIFLSVFHMIVMAQPLCSYTAKISDNDKKNSAGTSLTSSGVSKSSLAAIIRQDRANYHQFKLRDAEDEGDCLFSDKQMRAKIEGMINSSQIDAKVIESVVEKNPVITVTVYQDKLDISVLNAQNAGISRSEASSARLAAPTTPPVNRKNTNDGSVEKRDESLNEQNLVGEFQCEYPMATNMSTSEVVMLPEGQVHTYRVNGSSGIYTSPTKKIGKMRLSKVTIGPEGTSYAYDKVEREGVPVEYVLVHYKKNNSFGSTLSMKTARGEIVAIASICLRLR